MIVVIVIMIILSAFFSATETAFTSANRIRLKSLASEGKHRAEYVLRITEKYDRLISCLLIGNNIVNIVASTVATVLFTTVLPENGATWSTVVMTLVVLFFGEITPKTVAKMIPERFAMAVVPIIGFLMALLKPIIVIIQFWQNLLSKMLGDIKDTGITEEELMTMIDEVQEDGILDEDETELIRSAIEFTDVTAEEILTHRVNIIGVDHEMTMKEVGEVFNEHTFSRLPVYNETIDDIIGILHERDYMRLLLAGDEDWHKVIQPAECFPENVKIQHLLQSLQQQQAHMAVIVDEFGGTQGIVTMEDILEELVGEIWDEHDEVVVDYEELEDHSYSVSGAMNIDEFFETLDLDVDTDEYESSTVSGWVSEMLGKLPHAGDAFEYDQAKEKIASIKVLQVEDRKVARILVTLRDKPEEDEDDKNE